MCMLNLETLFFISSKSSATCNRHAMGLDKFCIKLARVCSVYLSDSFDLNAVLFAPFQFILVKKKRGGESVAVCTRAVK